MSNENEKVSLGSYMAFPGLILGAKAIKKAKTSGGPIKAIQALKKETQDFKNINEALKGYKLDTFKRSQILEEKYTELQAALKQSKKLSKLSLKDKVLNLFREEKVTVESFKEAKAAADNTIKNVENLSKSEVAIKAAAKKAVGEGMIKTIGKNAISEMKNPVTIAFTALFELSNITEKVIPAFKNEGFKAGMKEVGKTLVKFGGELVSFAFGNSAGSALGSALGTIIMPGVGTSVGGFLGSMFGMIATGKVTDKVVNKITGEDKEANENKTENKEQQTPINLEA